MRKICKEKLKLERFELPREEAIKYMQEKDEPYKVELINDLPADAHLLLHPGRVHRPLRRPAPRLHRPHQGQRYQADAVLQRLLARRLQAQDAPAHLRRRLPEERRARPVPRRAGRSPQSATTTSSAATWNTSPPSTASARACPFSCRRARASSSCCSAGSKDVEQAHGYLLTKTPLMAKRELPQDLRPLGSLP